MWDWRSSSAMQSTNRCSMSSKPKYSALFSSKIRVKFDMIKSLLSSPLSKLWMRQLNSTYFILLREDFTKKEQEVIWDFNIGGENWWLKWIYYLRVLSCLYINILSLPCKITCLRLHAINHMVVECTFLTIWCRKSN